MKESVLRRDFISGLGFAPDEFQIKAFDSLDQGHSVLVAAPTGSGKTLVADYSVASALASNKRVFYTAPIKALSNQKFKDFQVTYGVDRVGLLTGDNSINPRAPLIVMTTEVLRNMIYAGNESFEDLHSVILDEVHYIQDTYRGQVWEEIIVHLPQEVLLVCLSATVSNVREVADWISTVRGATDFVVSDHRPVPLQTFYAAHDRDTGQLRVEPVLVEGHPNQNLRRIESTPLKSKRGGKSQRQRLGPPSRADLVDYLSDANLLPGIFFIFSRAQCDEAADALGDMGFSFNDEDAQDRVEAIVQSAIDGIDEEDFEILEISRFEDNLRRGIAPHHAGMIAPLKECVEQAFQEGLVKVVFATETLAVGVNMPARSVVIEKVTRYRGDHHELLSPSDFTQLTGRAGRRGLDERGVALVAANPFVRFDTVAGLVSNRSFNLRSVFRPSCNMAANLIATHSQREAQHLLNLSLAQYQSDKEVVLLERRRERLENELRQMGESVSLVDQTSIRSFKLGEVLRVDTDLYSGLVAVVSVAERSSGTRITAVDDEAERITFDASDLSAHSELVATISLPMPYVPQRRDFVVEVSRLLSAAVPSSRGPIKKQSKTASSSVKRLRREISDIKTRQSSMAGSVSARFTEVTALMEKRGFVDGWKLTDKGDVLRRIFHELDVLIAESLCRGLFDGLSEFELAEFVSCFVFESRGPESERSHSGPPKALKRQAEQLMALHRKLESDLDRAGLPAPRDLDFNLCHAIRRWMSGLTLAETLEDDYLSVGDFVRTVRNLIDLLGQIEEVAPSVETRSAAKRATAVLDRGVVRLAAGVA